MDRPAPAMRAERLARALECRLEERDPRLRALQGEIVEAEIDERADLDVAVLDPLPDVAALVVQLDGAGEVAEFLTEPPKRISHAREHEMVLALARQRTAPDQRVPRGPIVAAADQREAAVGHPEDLVEPVVDLARRALQLERQRDGVVEPALPV